ncbi:signal recognition particle-docking protein FtsY [Methanobrevibacter sp. OttesenSCG-928-K11]|nr:signal recognition particle-docking protein FtsY [Methanobrevibacter sp. OttesenSCG-928-K11]MDL2270229.1 signal recognition particle-docking protein FtsY [Methanobrevibacter sp. OttesenSCG-928-I08]
MFESLKKKFSRTSNKLTEELTEEAQEENNIETTSEKPEESELKITEDSSVEENTSFFSKFRSNKDDDDEVETSEEESTGDSTEENTGFFSKFRSNKDDSEAETSDNLVEDEDIIDDDEEDVSTEEKSGFFSKFKKDNESEEKEEKKSGLFSFIKEKTISEKHVEDILWELEMGLLEGDVAIDVANVVVDSVKNDLVGQKIKRSSDIEEYTYTALRNAVGKIIDIPGKNMTELIEEKKAKGEPLIVMFVGINGTGKTTTIGKLANYYTKKGYTPVIAASDTFRAGAIEQITHHADNLDVKIIKHQKGSDPAAVAFDAVEHAKAKEKELVLIDTAGRMQNNTNLMDEMKKIKRVSKPDLVIFVGDALTGNDATEQASKFNEAIDIDGVILTKADADSKGGASLSIGYVIKKPILFLGMGQGYDDIMEYDSEWMLNQLFSPTEEIGSIEE